MAKPSKGIAFGQKLSREAGRVLTPEALRFTAELHRAFADERQSVLAHRDLRQAQFENGSLPEFEAGTAAIREGAWKAAPVPRDLLDQRTAVVSPLSRKDILSGLNSGARVCIADFADSTSPVFDALIDGQINLMDRWTSAMEHVDPATGKRVSLAQRLAVLTVRPRPLHLDDPRVKIDGKAVSASLFDAGLYLFHNARVALAKASGPYLSLSGIEGRLEARLWNDILVHAQSLLQLPVGSIRVNVGVDSVAAMFELDEIIHELREHICVLTLDVRRYAVSCLKGFGSHKARLTGVDPAVNAAAEAHLIRVAHRRGCLALLGNFPAMDAERAVRSGFDGVWASGADELAAAAKVFNADMPTPNQVYVGRDDAAASPKDLLDLGNGPRSMGAFAGKIRTALAAYECWLGGRNADFAGAELARAQLWQWVLHGASLDTGKATAASFEQCLGDLVKEMKTPDGHSRAAAALLKSLVLAKTCAADFTVPAMRKLA